MMKNNEKLYKTSDLALASVLSYFFRIEDIERIDPQRVSFVFENTLELQKTVEKFWKEKLKVEPQRYFNEIKNIKNRIYTI